MLIGLPATLPPKSSTAICAAVTEPWPVGVEAGPFMSVNTPILTTSSDICACAIVGASMETTSRAAEKPLVNIKTSFPMSGALGRYWLLFNRIRTPASTRRPALISHALAVIGEFATVGTAKATKRDTGNNGEASSGCNHRCRHGRSCDRRGAAAGRNRCDGLRAGGAVHAPRGRHPGRLQRHEGAARAWAGGEAAQPILLSALLE